MGLRVVGLHLENCGSRTYSLEGYPVLQLLDAEHQPVDGIEILRGTDGIPMAGGDEGPPRPVTLRPGESAVSGLAWRNTTEFGEAVTVPYVRVRAEAGADPVTVAPHLDLGTTGELGVRPWRKDETEAGRGTGDSGSGRPGAQVRTACLPARSPVPGTSSRPAAGRGPRRTGPGPGSSAGTR